MPFEYVSGWMLMRASPYNVESKYPTNLQPEPLELNQNHSKSSSPTCDYPSNADGGTNQTQLQRTR
eukprot:1604334-Amphidinium_carterae.1